MFYSDGINNLLNTLINGFVDFSFQIVTHTHFFNNNIRYIGCEIQQNIQVIFIVIINWMCVLVLRRCDFFDQIQQFDSLIYGLWCNQWCCCICLAIVINAAAGIKTQYISYDKYYSWLQLNRWLLKKKHKNCHEQPKYNNSGCNAIEGPTIEWTLVKLYHEININNECDMQKKKKHFNRNWQTCDIFIWIESYLVCNRLHSIARFTFRLLMLFSWNSRNIRYGHWVPGIVACNAK